MRHDRWYFGWNIVAASAVLTLLSVGMRLGVGPFFLPIAHDLGFSRSLLASIIAVGMICSFGVLLSVVAGTLVLGRWSDRLPRRNILALIYGVRGLGFFALMMVGTQLELYAAASIGGMISAWLGGWGYGHFGTHWVAFGAAGMLLLAAAVSLQLPVRNVRMLAPA